jgi:hypothetical protein
VPSRILEAVRGRAALPPCGTLGGLLKDPTVYEDLNTVLGNVKRNTLFKALIRYTVEEDEPRKVP